MTTSKILTEKEIDVIARKQIYGGEIFDLIFSLRASRQEEKRLKAGILKQGEELKYIDGIVVKATGKPMEPNDTYRDRILNYVKSLEAENERLTHISKCWHEARGIVDHGSVPISDFEALAALHGLKAALSRPA